MTDKAIVLLVSSNLSQKNIAVVTNDACMHALPWLKVFKEGGVIYLEVVMVDRNKGKMDRTSYWGRRFETLCVLGVEGSRLDELQRGPDDPPRPSYCALYRSRLGNHNVLMGEVDACLSICYRCCCWFGFGFAWLRFALVVVDFYVFASLLWLVLLRSWACGGCRAHRGHGFEPQGTAIR